MLGNVIFNPEKNNDINKSTLKIRKQKKFLGVSQIGLFSALNDAEQKKFIIYSLKKTPKVNPTTSQFSIFK